MTLFTKVAGAIAARATWKRALILFAVTYSVYFCMLLFTIPSVGAYTNGMKIFDLQQLGYSFPYAQTLLHTLGDEGARVYLTRQLPLDFLYPGGMGLTGAVFLSLLIPRQTKGSSLLICLPLAAALMDYMENVMVITMLNRHANLPHWPVVAANWFTISKSMLSTIYYGVLILYSILRFVSYIKQKPGVHGGQKDPSSGA
ncbi:hypothetical protein [Gorillibacterium sp. sgz5001074]|uniref:hypothetical protein n=1 Tax=Gorillibacterium sp. sgz5001074 TaxID=3446695 RepID=UPI003F67B2C8